MRGIVIGKVVLGWQWHESVFLCHLLASRGVEPTDITCVTKTSVY